MQDHHPKQRACSPNVTLRDIQPADIPTLHAFESDPQWCAMAMLKPRSLAAFEAVWTNIFEDWAGGVTKVVQKSILFEGQLCGTVGCRLAGDRWEVGYGLGRAFWGRGIASCALAMMLAEVALRPLYAVVAASNTVSIRVLEKHGFEIAEKRVSPETKRYLPCEELIFALA